MSSKLTPEKRMSEFALGGKLTMNGRWTKYFNDSRAQLKGVLRARSGT